MFAGGMAVAVRSRGTGRAVSRYDRLDLYEVVREVALVAVERALAAGERLDPLSLSQEQWDEAREFSLYRDAPRAKKVCERLSDRCGRSFPWRELLELVFDKGADIGQVEVARTRSEALVALTPDAVYYSLNLVARRCGAATLTLGEHTRASLDLIAADRRRRAGGGALAEALLSAGQIIEVCGSWPDALRHAGLEVTDAHYSAGRVSVKEGALRFYLELGVLPTAKLLRAFASVEGFALEDVDWSTSWATQIGGFADHILKQAGKRPPAYVPAETRAAWTSWLEVRGGPACEPAADGSGPARASGAAAGGEDRVAGAGARAHPGVSPAPRPYTRKRFWPLKSEILEQLEAFIAWELPDGLMKRTTAAYKRWAQEEQGRPSLDAVQKFGPLGKLIREARCDGAAERARAEEATAARRAQAEKAERLKRKHAESPKGRELLGLLHSRGEMTRRQLEQELDWPQRTVNTYLAWLTEAGAVMKLGENGRRARYRATATAQTD